MTVTNKSPRETTCVMALLVSSLRKLPARATAARHNPPSSAVAAVILTSIGSLEEFDSAIMAPLSPLRGRAVLFHPPFGRVGPLRAGEGYALDPMLSPPLASLDPPRGRVMTNARQYSI
ncbi:hypothetical protein CEE69_28950 [Rhodopirellula bahusiensis]|uniref:Uncharacterized protein n=1 Tax=Rhodopirellula bahusiensis TaxID=2014065 RepID=A0A2G1VYG3_9BACT|nr:hypothetical protein CEE69_28950 [Rhodopirellula bahusiensis]